KAQNETNPPWAAQATDKFVEEPRGRKNNPRGVTNWSKNDNEWVQNSENFTSSNQSDTLKSEAWW
ncbi:14919_t:CDS:1, partial [Dentiscutata heterogama]